MEFLAQKSREKNKDVKKVAEEKKFVTINIGGDLFGIDVMKVNTISGLTDIRAVPDALPYMKGVITIRETIVPIVDMRIRFKCQDTGFSKTTVIVIVILRKKLVGLIVDSVSDVIHLAKSDIQDTPHFSDNIDRDSIEGIVKLEDRTVIILDVDSIVTQKELDSIAEAEGKAS